MGAGAVPGGRSWRQASLRARLHSNKSTSPNQQRRCAATATTHTHPNTTHHHYYTSKHDTPPLLHIQTQHANSRRALDRAAGAPAGGRVPLHVRCECWWRRFFLAPPFGPALAPSPFPVPPPFPQRLLPAAARYRYTIAIARPPNEYTQTASKIQLNSARILKHYIQIQTLSNSKFKTKHQATRSPSTTSRACSPTRRRSTRR